MESKSKQKMRSDGTLIEQQDEHGYSIVWLEKDGVETCHRVDKLVWEAFNGPIPSNMIIEHIDGNKLNNRLDNLKLVSVRCN